MSSQGDHHLVNQSIGAMNGNSTVSSCGAAAAAAAASTSKSSLFDRVANFRRSLIKSQHKKNKIRPSSGTFNFFKPSSSSSNLSGSSSSLNNTNGVTAGNSGNKCSTSNGTFTSSGQFEASSSLSSFESSSQSKNGHHHSSTSSASNLRHSIIVDEEDAIYGFTSLHLNNQTSLRRQFNKQSSVDSGASSSGSNGIKSSSFHRSSASPSHQLFTSSSCISLYETIDEVEPIGPSMSSSSSGESCSIEAAKGMSSPLHHAPPPLPPSNPKSSTTAGGGGHFTQNYSKMRGGGGGAASSHHSSRQLRMSTIHDSDWKRNRRSSAIIFGSDFHDLIDDDGDEPTSMLAVQTSGSSSGHSHHQQNGFHQSASTRFHHQVNGSAAVANGHHHHPLSMHHHHPLNHSSDDLLLMSHRSAHSHHHNHHYHQASIATESSHVSEPTRSSYINGCGTVANGTRIYENLLNGAMHHNQHHHSHHHKRSDTNRKLTKDSGYESASTLVSLTQLNGGGAGVHLQSSPQPPTPLPPSVHHYALERSTIGPSSTITGSPPNQNSGTFQLISSPTMGNSHYRSDSIDSANSLGGELMVQSPSPPLPKCLPDIESDSPPLPLPPPPSSLVGIEDDSRPPTPPVRFSSLPQNRSFLHRHNHHREVPPLPSATTLPPSDVAPQHDPSLDRNVHLWQQMQHSFASFDHHQMERLSAAQLRGMTNQQSSTSCSPPLPPPPPELDQHHRVFTAEYHHVKQDSWPSSSYGSGSNRSSPYSSRRRHNTAATRSMLLSSTGDLHCPVATTTTPPAAVAGATASSQPCQTSYQRQQSYPAKPYASTSTGAIKHTNNHGGNGGSSTSAIITQSPSLSSLSNMIAASTSVRHSIASCSTSALAAAAAVGGGCGSNGNNGYTNYQPAPAQQIARSHRVQQVPRQELCMPAPPAPVTKPPSQGQHRVSLETSLDDLTNDLPEEVYGHASASSEVVTSPPPPLPPKNCHSTGNSPTATGPPYQNGFVPSKSDFTATGDHSNRSQSTRSSTATTKCSATEQLPPTSSITSNSEIKAIQKRAVYEFYLRQKEKKEKEKKSSSSSSSNSSSESPSRSNSASSSGSSSSASSTATLTPPIETSVNSECSQPKNNSRSEQHLQQQMHHKENEDDDDDIIEEELPLPTPPPPLSMPPDSCANGGGESSSVVIKAGAQHCTAEPNRFFSESESTPLVTDASTFPPPPTPVATGSESSPALSPFPAPPTPLAMVNTSTLTSSTLTSASGIGPMSPAFPPPPTPICSTPGGAVNSFDETYGVASPIGQPHTQRPPLAIQMYHSIDLSTLWPMIDFTKLLEPLPMPPTVTESNLDDCSGPDSGSDNSQEEEEEDDEELVSIEANRERQQQFTWRLSQLEAEQRRVELEMQRNESIVGQLVHSRLAVGGSAFEVDRNKLELLCNDMIMIIRLMVSIVQQLTRNEAQLQQHSAKVLSSKSHRLANYSTASGSSPIETKDGADSNGTSTSSGSSSDANDVVNNHRDGVHCSTAATDPAAENSTMITGDEEASVAAAAVVDLCQQKRIRLLSQLEEAKRLRDNIQTRRTMLEQRVARKCAAKNGNSKTVATNQPSMMNITNGCNKIGTTTNNNITVANGAATDHYLVISGSECTSVSNTTNTTTTGLLLTDDIDLTTLIRHYLSNKEYLLVQQEVGKLLHDDLLQTTRRGTSVPQQSTVAVSSK